MTDSQLRSLAVSHLKQTTVSYQDWDRLRKAGRYPHDGRDTHWGQALGLLGQIRQPPPVPVPAPTPPPGPNLALGRSWIFMAQEPNKAVDYPPYYGIAFTADSAYEKPSAATVTTLRDRGQRVRSWCDCHSTFPETAKAMARNLNLDGWIGEGESSPAFDVAYAGGADLIIGNLSALMDDRRDVAENGLCWYDEHNPGRSRRTILQKAEVIWINELYLNQDESRAGREDWMNLPVAGRCIAAYDASREADTGKRFPVSQYLAMGKFQAHRDSFYDPGATDEDRRLLP